MDDKNDLSTGTDSERQTIIDESKSDDSNENGNINTAVHSTSNRNILNTVEEDNKMSKTAEKERKLDDLLRAWACNKVETNQENTENKSFGESEKFTNAGVTKSSHPNIDSNISLQEGIKESNNTSTEHSVIEKKTCVQSETFANAGVTQVSDDNIDSNIILQEGIKESNNTSTEHNVIEKKTCVQSETFSNAGVTQVSDDNIDSNISLQEGIKESNNTSTEHNIIEKKTCVQSETFANAGITESSDDNIDSNISLQEGVKESSYLSIIEHNFTEKKSFEKSEKITNSLVTESSDHKIDTNISLQEVVKESSYRSDEHNVISKNITQSTDETDGTKPTESNLTGNSNHFSNAKTPSRTVSDINMPLNPFQICSTSFLNRPSDSKKRSQESFDLSMASRCQMPAPLSSRKPKGHSKCIATPKTASSFTHDGIKYCMDHCIPVRYWCHQCASPKCERCVNVAYSKRCINHDVLALVEYVRMRKDRQKIYTQEHSKECLTELDRNINVLKQKDQITELQGLIQRGKIRQDFTSFHQLLMEEEKKILANLEKNIDEYAAETKLVQNEYVSLVEEEANLMCDTLCRIDKDDPYAENLDDVDKFIDTKWPELQKKSHKISDHIRPVPCIMQENFTLKDHKIRIQTSLDTALDPIEVIPLSFIVYLEKADIPLPIKVNDLFTCRNSKHEFHEFELEVTVLNGRRKISQERLYFNDYILNIEGKHFLQDYQRYRVQAKPLFTIFSDGHASTPCRNVLIITDKSKDDKVQYIENVRRMYGHLSCVPRNTDTRNENYLKWKQSTLWPFSSVHGSKEFYDISPEELRFLAYSLNVHSYANVPSYMQRLYFLACGYQ